MRAGQLLRSLRKELGLNQIDFSKHVGISQGCLSKVESGKIDAQYQTVRRAARLSQDYLPIGARRVAWEREFINHLFGD